MRHRKTTVKLGRTAAHRKAMLANMATSLFENGQVITTIQKAKAVRSYSEKLITLGKRGDLHARRLAARKIHSNEILKKLFNDIAPLYKDTPGGYTRIIRLYNRKGDGADMAILRLTKEIVGKNKEKKDTSSKKKPSLKEKLQKGLAGSASR